MLGENVGREEVHLLKADWAFGMGNPEIIQNSITSYVDMKFVNLPAALFLYLLIKSYKRLLIPRLQCLPLQFPSNLVIRVFYVLSCL